MKKTVTYVLVADGARARLYSNHGVGKGLQPVSGATHKADLHHHDREILTDKPGRQTAVPSFLGGLTPVTELETASSRRLAAPPGTSLDATDAAFCASGRFRETRGAPGVSAWGVCQ